MGLALAVAVQQRSCSYEGLELSPFSPGLNATATSVTASITHLSLFPLVLTALTGKGSCGGKTSWWSLAFLYLLSPASIFELVS